MAKNENNVSNKLENSKKTKVIVKFPDKLELAMVQANELKHYELFNWLVVLLAPIASGFWTAYVIDKTKSAPLWWSALIFTAITILFIGLAIVHRRRVFYGSVEKSIDLDNLE